MVETAAWKTARDIKVGYKELFYYIIITYAGRLGVDQPNPQEVGEVGNELQVTVHIKDCCFSSPSGGTPSEWEVTVNDLPYKLTHDRLEQVPEHVAAKEGDE